MNKTRAPANYVDISAENRLMNVLRSHKIQPNSPEFSVIRYRSSPESAGLVEVYCTAERVCVVIVSLVHCIQSVRSLKTYQNGIFITINYFSFSYKRYFLKCYCSL